MALEEESLPPAVEPVPAPEADSRLKVTAALCWVGWVFDFYDLILIAFLITAIEKSLHCTPEQSAWLLGIGLGASGLGGILFGWLADIYGRKPVLSGTIILFSLGMLASGFVQTPEQFFAARFITGLGLGGEWAVGHALIAESVPAQHRARWSALLQSGEPVGVALAAIVGFSLMPMLAQALSHAMDIDAAHTMSWRIVFVVSAFTGLLALLFRRHLHESPLWLKSPKTPSVERMRKLGPFVRDFWPLMLLAWVLAVFKLGTYWTCYNWLPRFIHDTFGSAINKSTLWILLGQVGQFIGMYGFGVMADRLGRRWAFTAFSLVTAMALLPLALFWNDLFLHAKPLFWGLIFMLGLGSGCTAGFGALLAELFPTAQRTFAMGTVYNLARGIQVFAPMLVLMAVNHAGLTGGLLVPTTLALLTAAWVWTLPDRRGEPLTT
jgi:MFS family permease